MSDNSKNAETQTKRNEPQNADLNASVLFVSEYNNENPPVVDLCSPESPMRRGLQVCETPTGSSSPDTFEWAICFENLPLSWDPCSIGWWTHLLPFLLS
ncbi:hypothetical protein DMENIID0001_139010 [Sergentomyia squamirostris]